MVDDVDRLVEFLKQLDQLISFFFEVFLEVIPRYLQPSLRNVRQPYENRSNALKAELERRSPEQMQFLEDHGLTGVELDVKLAGFEGAFNEFQASRDDKEGMRWLPWLKRALDWAEIILGSLGVFPPLAALAGALNELRGVVKNAIEAAERPTSPLLLPAIFPESEPTH